MEELVFFDSAKSSIISFFEREFEGFPPLLLSHFLNKFNEILNYTEEGVKIRPKIIFTDNIDAIVKTIPKSYAMAMFEDVNPSMFNSRLKSICSIMENDWCLYIEIKEGKIIYGVVMSFRSIKDKSFLQSLEENTSLKDRQTKVRCIIAHPQNYNTMLLHSTSCNDLILNSSLDNSKNSVFLTEIREFVDTTFSKLRTTQRKLQDIKNLYQNIFSHVMSNVNGAICVIVDKDYNDTGMFEDGIWLKEPISFSKLFTQTKSYSEAKLQAYANLFVNMLSFDGITIIDNQGKIRAYNVFVETNTKKLGNVIGGARKRAAYHILNSRKKNIIGVYFQSHEGEVFFEQVKKPDDKPLKHSKPKPTKETPALPATSKEKEAEQKPTNT